MTSHPASGGQFHATVTLENRALPVQRTVICIFADTVSITTRSLTKLFSMIRGGSAPPARTLLATLASAFLALGQHHEILRRLDIQLLALRSRSPWFHGRNAAHALLGRARDHPLDPRQFRRQRLAARMLANPFLRCSPRHRLAGTLRLHFGGAHSRFTPVTPAVRVSSRCRTIHLDALQRSRSSSTGSLVLHIAAPGTFCSRWQTALGQFALQLFEKFVEGGSEGFGLTITY